MNEHPPSHRLEELAAGVADEETEKHVAACDACRAYKEKLAAGARAFAAGPHGDADAFVDKVLARAESERERPAQSGATVRKLALTRLAWITAPLAAAAIFLLVMRPTGVSPIQGTTEVRFKGAAPAIAAVVERDGRQERMTREVRARAGDRLRIEVSVDREGPIVAGILEADGTWTALLAPAQLDAGTHFSEQAARFDDSPKAGWVLAGAPDAVERARQTRDFHDVAVLPIVPEK